MRRHLPLLLLVALVAPAAAHATPSRVSLAVLGDSIVESGHLQYPERDGLVAQLRRQFVRRGHDPGAGGFVSPHPAGLERVGPALSDKGRWRYTGDWAWVTDWPRAFAHLLSWTQASGASATLPTRGAGSVSLLYLSGPDFGRFALSVNSKRIEVDAHAATPGIGSRTLRVSGHDQLDVSAVADGGMGLLGAFLRRAPRPGRTQLELTAFARAGAQGADPPSPLETRSLGHLRPRVTLIVFGINDAILYAGTRDPAVLDRLRTGLESRGRRARRTGACLIVPPGHGNLSDEVHAPIRRTVSTAARASGCTVSPVLDELDGRPHLTLDGFHPSPAGYAQLAATLAPRLASIALKGIVRHRYSRTRAVTGSLARERPAGAR